MDKKAALVVIAVALMAGCASNNTATRESSVNTTAATPQSPSQVTIPATKNDPDPTYEIRNTASVINDSWYDGRFGKVTVMAKRAQSTSNHGPLLTGTLKVADGTAVECKQFRSTIWADFDEFEPLDMRCPSELDLATVVSVDIVSAHGAALQKP